MYYVYWSCISFWYRFALWLRKVAKYFYILQITLRNQNTAIISISQCEQFIITIYTTGLHWRPQLLLVAVRENFQILHITTDDFCLINILCTIFLKTKLEFWLFWLTKAYIFIFWLIIAVSEFFCFVSYTFVFQLYSAIVYCHNQRWKTKFVNVLNGQIQKKRTKIHTKRSVAKRPVTKLNNWKLGDGDPTRSFTTVIQVRSCDCLSFQLGWR